MRRRSRDAGHMSRSPTCTKQTVLPFTPQLSESIFLENHFLHIWLSLAQSQFSRTGGHPSTTPILKSAVERCHVASRCPWRIRNELVLREEERRKKLLINLPLCYFNYHTNFEARSGDTSSVVNVWHTTWEAGEWETPPIPGH